MSKFGTKNVLYGYIWLVFEKSILIFEINTPNCKNVNLFLILIVKFREKIKIPKYGCQNA